MSYNLYKEKIENINTEEVLELKDSKYTKEQYIIKIAKQEEQETN